MLIVNTIFFISDITWKISHGLHGIAGYSFVVVVFCMCVRPAHGQKMILQNSSKRLRDINYKVNEL